MHSCFKSVITKINYVFSGNAENCVMAVKESMAFLHTQLLSDDCIFSALSGILGNWYTPKNEVKGQP